jgi:hypothetical protein
MFGKLFGFIQRKKKQTASILNPNTWGLIDIIEYEHLPHQGEYIYLSKPGQYYVVVSVIHYVDFDGKVLIRYLTASPVEIDVVKPGNKKS